MREMVYILSHVIPDRLYLKIKYYQCLRRRLRLNDPTTFNEKLNWLKLYDRNPEYMKMVDKYEVREHIAKTIGEEYLIPLFSVYDDVEDIDWSELPRSFVLKCTHGSGFNIICRDKTKLDIVSSKKKLQKWMRENLFWYGREWPYKYVQPRIICESYMVDESGIELKDYKIFCFGGEPKLIQVDYDRFTNHKRNLYDMDWNYIRASIQYPSDPATTIKKPENLEIMINVSKKLAENIPHVRIDLYNIEGKVFFGEMTFYHGSGFEKFQPEDFNKQLGSWIDLPKSLEKS